MLGAWLCVLGMTEPAESVEVPEAEVATSDSEAAEAPRETHRVGFAGLGLVGDVPATWTEPMRRILDRALSKAGAAIVDMTPPAVCDGPCLRELVGSNADFVLVGSLSGDQRIYTLVLEMHDVASGESLRSEQTCAPCGQSEVEELVERQTTALVVRALRLDITPARIEVVSRPEGAEVSLDGKVVGTTPLQLPMTPGRHEIRIHRPGFVELSREVVAVRGVSERWDADLRAMTAPTSTPPPRDARPRSTRPLAIAGWTSLGVGVAALAAGTTFLVLHHRPYRARCDGDDYDASADLCRYRYDGVPWGASLAAVGAAATISGAVLLGVVGKRRRDTRHGSARARARSGGVALTAGPGGAFVGLHWRG